MTRSASDGAGHGEAVPRVGVSRCLLGDSVRYDAGHKRDRYVTGALARHVELVAVCPEVEAGLGVPREAMHLEGDRTTPMLITTKTRRDLTKTMRSWASAKAEELARLELDGFVLKSKSPSCGLERVPVHRGVGAAPRPGRGLFASALLEAMPDVPAEEEGRLHDAALRENFVVRVFSHRRFRLAARRPRSRGALVDFHTRHKLLLLSRDETAMRALGRLVAGASERDTDELFVEYRGRFFDALTARPTPERHTNVLQHIAGHLREVVGDWDRREIAAAIERYRVGEAPLVVPLTLLRHHADKHDIGYALSQVYLFPSPGELLLQNRA